LGFWEATDLDSSSEDVAISDQHHEQIATTRLNEMLEYMARTPDFASICRRLVVYAHAKGMETETHG
jgi:hypothetical protein